MEVKQVLINKINKSYWWHVTPSDSDAYSKRGKFLASTFHQAEFYGRPNDAPEKVSVINPIWSDSELSIIKTLFPESYKEKYKTVINADRDYYKKRIKLDEQMHQRAKKLGFDAIVLLGSTGVKALSKNRKPHSMELNLCV